MNELKSTAELVAIYRRSYDNMRQWLGEASLRFDEKMGIIDAWQEELRTLFRLNGHCFACEQPADSCLCPEPLDQSLQ